ncbi:PaaI family thioesterase [Sphingomicrobium lutaoense]|uniref:Uncharacterized protein (TIGR00369 family) n=1 Tax=Sphingomicrobium lutaoense TaxID=515949 RepID=A0A839YTQ8_9SPHN|nr:PaaI family thioesterase [Sphingomicrobium lutaoense]MBB3763651.1 uncharacterized protein (TIGR00369 family) [Sphingomicrobium lutaoense]
MKSPTSAEADALTRGDFDIERFVGLAGNFGHGKAVGYRYRDHGDNWVELELPSRPELVGVPEQNILASGAIFSLVDMCGGASVFQTMGLFEPIVTIDLRLDYLRPALLGDSVFARCECYKMTSRVAFVRGTAFLDEERQLANVTGTYMRRP